MIPSNSLEIGISWRYERASDRSGSIVEGRASILMVRMILRNVSESAECRLRSWTIGTSKKSRCMQCNDLG